MQTKPSGSSKEKRKSSRTKKTKLRGLVAQLVERAMMKSSTRASVEARLWIVWHLLRQGYPADDLKPGEQDWLVNHEYAPELGRPSFPLDRRGRLWQSERPRAEAEPSVEPDDEEVGQGGSWLDEIPTRR